MATIRFELTTPERVIERGEVESISATTPLGEITILPGHIPLVTSLVPGILRVKKGGVYSEIAVLGGFLEVKRDDNRTPHSANAASSTRVIILADAAERAEEIDEKRAEEARARAKKALEEYRNTDEVKFAEAAAAFERAIVRLRTAKRKRHH